ncbi:MAG: SDR family oxidoreductase [Ilumatobacter sp.]|nr:SDR family oxidoreductase [Ilumatobacter sp.]
MSARGRRRLMLVFGGSGFLGRHLDPLAAAARWDIVAPSSESVDVRRRSTVVHAITDWKPHAVVNLAYRKGDRPTTVDGARHIAEGAEACGARLVHLSTDVVFGGRAAPYHEQDRPDPATEYGRQKRDAERAVIESCPGAVVLRTSLLYGTGHMAPLQHDVRLALATGPEHRSMTFFTDEYRCPAHAADVAAAITELARRPDVTGPLHVAGPDAVSRADFARAIASWLGLDPTRLTTSTIGEAGMSRPARVVLDTTAATALGITCRPLAEGLAR